MTRSLPSSELQLIRAQIRELVACPWCATDAGRPCEWFLEEYGGDHERARKAREAGVNHRQRVAAARALLRTRRLT